MKKSLFAIVILLSFLVLTSADPQPKADMVGIRGVTFTMGSPDDEPWRNDDETQHQVTLSAYYIGKYEVTQKEYTDIMGEYANNSYFKAENLPIENVSWYDAVEYCNLRSLQEGFTPAYEINKRRNDPDNTNENDEKKWIVTWDRTADGYRLPTEAEWEFACRANNTTAFSTGPNIGTRMANFSSGADYRQKTLPVNGFSPNAFGLYNMHGNVQEWCWDWYGDYAGDEQTDPTGADSGTQRVLRGGSWSSEVDFIRSASRHPCNPSDSGNDFGFRLARSVVPRLFHYDKYIAR